MDLSHRCFTTLNVTTIHGLKKKKADLNNNVSVGKL